MCWQQLSMFLSQLSTILDDHFLCRLSRLTSNGLHFFHHIHPFGDRAEDDMLVIQPLGLCSAQEELRTIGVGSCIRHGQDSLTGMLQSEVFIRKFISIDALPTGSIVVGEVATLTHESRNDTMKR